MTEAIHIVSKGEHNPHRAHERVKEFYDWADVTERTECVYEAVFATEPYDFWTRMYRCVTILNFSNWH